MTYEFMHHLKMASDIAESNRSIAYQKPIGLFVTDAFLPISQKEIINAESRLGFLFPSGLRQFYEELGAGTVHTGRGGQVSTSHNYVVYPPEIPKLIDGTCEWMMPDTQFESDTLPFFERDIGLFLCLKPNSANPEAVYWMWGGKICDSLVEFFRRLVDDPDWFNPSSG